MHSNCSLLPVMTTVTRYAMVILFAVLFLHCSSAQIVHHEDPVDLAQLRRLIDSARIALETKDYPRAVDILRKNFDRVDALIKHDQVQGAAVYRQQEQIFDLRQKYQLL